MNNNRAHPPTNTPPSHPTALPLPSGSRVDTAVECSSTSPEYQLLLVFTLPFMFLYQAIPLGWAYLLNKHRAELNPPIEDQVRAFERRAKDRR